MRKFFCVLLSFLLIIILNILAINISINDMIIQTISNTFVKTKVGDMVSDFVMEKNPDIDSEKLLQLQESINNSKEINDITSSFFEGIIDNDSNDLSINKEISNFIEKNRDKFVEYGVEDSEIDKIVEDVENDEDLDKLYDEVKENVNNNLTKEQKFILDFYRFIKSSSLRWGLVFGVILICGLIALIIKSLWKMFLYSGISFLISGLIVRFGLVNLINLASWAITDDTIGRSSEINTSLLVNTGYVYIGIGVIFIIGNIVMKKLKK